MFRFPFLLLTLVVAAVSARAQPVQSLQPVLFDADDQPLGIVVDHGDPVLIQSLRGYRGFASGNFNARSDGSDYAPSALAFGVFRYFASSNCSGPAVIARTDFALPTRPLQQQESYSRAARVTRTYRGAEVRSGDLVLLIVDQLSGDDPIEDHVYYLPKRTRPTSGFYPSSVENGPGECLRLDASNPDAVDAYGLLEVVTVDLGSGPVQRFVIRRPTFLETELRPFDPAVTGFAVATGRGPFEIRWIDVARVFADGFEPPPADR